MRISDMRTYHDDVQQQDISFLCPPFPGIKRDRIHGLFFGCAQNFKALNLTPGPIVEETTTLFR